MDPLLYKSESIEIKVFPGDPECHEIYFPGSDNAYLLPRGILKDVAKTPRKVPIIPLQKLDNVNTNIFFDADKLRISKDQILDAVVQAYITQVENESEHYRMELSTLFKTE